MSKPKRPRCAATKPYAFREGEKQCPKPATHGQWCRMHAQSIGGWQLVPPDPDGYRALASSFWVYYRCGLVGCRTVEPHEHGGATAMTNASERTDG